MFALEIDDPAINSVKTHSSHTRNPSGSGPAALIPASIVCCLFVCLFVGLILFNFYLICCLLWFVCLFVIVCCLLLFFIRCLLLFMCLLHAILGVVVFYCFLSLLIFTFLFFQHPASDRGSRGHAHARRRACCQRR